ncbi:MAG TPA: class I SAM-dependent methyltransferase [Chryseolinea sp.]|nr:class I SAM-dependent methyltransferase [Chryseolinea sp.]
MTSPYTHSELVHNMTAPRHVVPVVLNFVQPSSVLDVGCGTGTWLKAFEEQGIKDYLGVDGDYVDRSLLRIPYEKFLPMDISKPVQLARKFDLVVSLEVAEHLAAESADTFVRSLVSHGDVILFSAAIPGQGGQNHLNEQWPEYWQEKFMKHGFYFHDLIRPIIWNDGNVDFWYRQNMFLLNRRKPESSFLMMVHPEQFAWRMNDSREYNESLMKGRQGIAVSSHIFVNALKFKLRTLLGLTAKGPK